MREEHEVYMREILIGKKYRHFKGNLYQVLNVGRDTESGEEVEQEYRFELEPDPYDWDDMIAKIRAAIMDSESTDPIAIAKSVMKEEFMYIHGPAHHFLDGAAFLKAFDNARQTGAAGTLGVRAEEAADDEEVHEEFEIGRALDMMAERAKAMPGAMCGFWGVCGAVSSLGAALSIINQVGPLSEEAAYGDQMEFTASVVGAMSRIGGPRCCKRNAMLSLSMAINFVRDRYGVDISGKPGPCDFAELNEQCIGGRCPFNK